MFKRPIMSGSQKCVSFFRLRGKTYEETISFWKKENMSYSHVAQSSACAVFFHVRLLDLISQYWE